MQLKAEILRAARVVLERDGESSVTLRSVGREVGVSAPAIYAHYSGRDDLLDAIVADAFSDLMRSVGNAIADTPDPIVRLRAFCHAYVAFASAHPGSYAVVFSRRYISELPQFAAAAYSAFEQLVEAIAETEPPSTPVHDTLSSATVFWASLHGLASLPPAWPRFPWRPIDELVDALVAAHTRAAR